MSSANSENAGEKPRRSGEADIETLRRSVEVEHRRLDELEARVANPELHTRAVSRVLPQAIAIRSRQDRALSDALEPTVESALRSAVRDDPKLIADAIFPIIGPAIRKSIFNALSTMVQRVDKARDESFTFHGLAWRWEALRTGRPFAEVVLMKSLVFRVEQALLIHRETGLLLQHVVARGVVVKDPQMVSGMLSAIQDFVRDSFQSGGGETLQLLRVGEVTVAIEQGPLAIVSVIVRGVPPTDLRAPLQGVVEKIHAEAGEELATFHGDTAPFVVVRSVLDSCLIERRREPRTGVAISKIVSVLVLIAALLFCVRYLVVIGIVRAERNRLVEVFEREPGYALLSTRIDLVDRQVHVHAMRDPLARDWRALLDQARADPLDVVTHFTLFESLDPEVLLERARDILEAPSSVTLSFENGVLHARGTAPHRWTARASAIAVAMPGIRAFDGTGLTDPMLDEARQLKREIEELRFLAGYGVSRVVKDGNDPPPITKSDDPELARLGNHLTELDRIAVRSGLFVRVRAVLIAHDHVSEAARLRVVQEWCSTIARLSLARVQCTSSVSPESDSGGDTPNAWITFTVDLIEADSVPEDKR